ncbi:hypothetical protein C7M84_025203 [Penaeus vannamei]|uniref:Uncharacterized protein n=1 Tax=Penaeus vannamei TaxID=6689 RepID=A0A423TYT2_PENVA|nr:hypothetical protein C7M84_025203 [Penaeus vannamei]
MVKHPPLHFPDAALRPRRTRPACRCVTSGRSSLRRAGAPRPPLSPAAITLLALRGVPERPRHYPSALLLRLVPPPTPLPPRGPCFPASSSLTASLLPRFATSPLPPPSPLLPCLTASLLPCFLYRPPTPPSRSPRFPASLLPCFLYDPPPPSLPLPRFTTTLLPLTSPTLPRFPASLLPCFPNPPPPIPLPRFPSSPASQNRSSSAILTPPSAILPPPHPPLRVPKEPQQRRPNRMIARGRNGGVSVLELATWLPLKRRRDCPSTSSPTLTRLLGLLLLRPSLDSHKETPFRLAKERLVPEEVFVGITRWHGHTYVLEDKRVVLEVEMGPHTHHPPHPPPPTSHNTLLSILPPLFPPSLPPPLHNYTFLSQLRIYKYTPNSLPPHPTPSTPTHYTNKPSPTHKPTPLPQRFFHQFHTQHPTPPLHSLHKLILPLPPIIPNPNLLHIHAN